MVISTALSLLVVALTAISSAIAKDPPLTNQTLSTAIEEMQRANYFAFVMLLNMVPTDKILSNITFLMPNNRVLSKAVIPENDVLDFLLRHSIPSSLRFDYLKYFPTGSIIPSSESKFMLRVSNNGRRNYYFNNAKLVSPDICVAGSSVMCHGIDGVFQDDNTSSAPPTFPPSSIAAAPSIPPPTGGGIFSLAPAATPQPAGSGGAPHRSESPCLDLDRSLIGYLSSWVLFLVVWFYL